MPRVKRKLSNTRVYHIMCRGIEKRNIFLDDEDKTTFLNILRRKQLDKNYSYLAYCLMTNHLHLIIDEGEEGISKIMQRINGGYAYYFNKKYYRSGHLFQDRYKSEAIESDYYLMAAIRYVHNNPVKARMVNHPEEYIWSSYRQITGKKNSVTVDKERILTMFADDTNEALMEFKAFSISDNEDRFIDINDKEEEKEYAKKITTDFLYKHGKHTQDFKQLEKGLRNELIINLKESTSLSIRDLSDVLDINRNTIQRIISNS
ncbi:hypothetical protein SYNTR_1423 [Candidatus Syntrophocurvum alkaliphilum]|uniref:Transposase IS200-like domain-containing protein n=1 Tax=Candidatus Syntrophocurvum alkaliphilum TaxID=2293317 RepID=A0A6I6DFX5_9FIRM|nr:transposase [Candidatus Syntrophocurvum alkaliphilum]QGU00017.1 hypothetical protein SYNTR_1423 [Candidatus Syntrophocurvum alkaliphilum]